MEAQMFPLVENPQHTERYDTFAELRVVAEHLTVGLNQIQSWFIYDQNDEDWGKDDHREFFLCICMPRKTAFTVWATRDFDRTEVEAWIESWVYPHIRAWYGIPS